MRAHVNVASGSRGGVREPDTLTANVPICRLGRPSLNWSTFLATLVAALTGGGFAIAGAVVAQRMTKQREFQLDEKRADRVRADEAAKRRREVITSAAEYAQNLDAQLESAENEHVQLRATGADVVHRDLLTARIRTLNMPLMQPAWLSMRVAEDWFDAEISLGNVSHTPGFNKAFIDSHEFFMIAAHAGIEAVMFAATAELAEGRDVANLSDLAITTRLMAASQTLTREVNDAFADVRGSDVQNRRQVERECAARMVTALRVSREAVIEWVQQPQKGLTAGEVRAAIDEALNAAAGGAFPADTGGLESPPPTAG
jgi:hypothetical protein